MFSKIDLLSDPAPVATSLMHFINPKRGVKKKTRISLNQEPVQITDHFDSSCNFPKYIYS